MQRGPRKAPPIETRLAATLEELYTGTTKRMKISRDIVDASGRTMRVSEVLEVQIKPGWKTGTKVTFAEKGECCMWYAFSVSIDQDFQVMNAWLCIVMKHQLVSFSICNHCHCVLAMNPALKIMHCE